MIHLYGYSNTLKGGHRLYALGHDLGALRSAEMQKQTYFN